jgi:2-polyprenyl-3-methyl-5-hydroxy-6-metoxy-1,4-benzoquinol methylase
MPVVSIPVPPEMGYGGKVKIGFEYALKEKVEAVAVLGEEEGAAEHLPVLFESFLAGHGDVVIGVSDGVPGFLTWLQNRFVGTSLTGYRSGLRVYAARLLACIPYEADQNGEAFNTDVLLQLYRIGARIREHPLPSVRARSVMRVGCGIACLRSCLHSRLHDMGIFYHAKFDTEVGNLHYPAKFHFCSSHSEALARVQPGHRVIDFGTGPGDMVRKLKEKGCRVSAVDLQVSPEVRSLCDWVWEGDLDCFDGHGLSRQPSYDQVLALDILEHLKVPERLLHLLRRNPSTRGAEYLITVPNVAFLPVRLLLLSGFFNYGKRGILDRTHVRLFTFRSLKRLLQQEGYQVLEMRGIPAPFPLAVRNRVLGRFLLGLNRRAIVLWKRLFSFQIMCRARPLPTLEGLLRDVPS